MTIQKQLHPIEWKPAYQTGIDFLDQQHQKYLEIVNSLVNSINQNKCKEDIPQLFFSLVFYAEHYLISEEMSYKEYDYSDFQEHQKMHRDFAKQIIHFQKNSENGNLQENCKKMYQYLISWFENHILGEDKKAGEFIITRR